MSMFNIVNGLNISLAPGGEARPGGGGTKRMGKIYTITTIKV